MLQLAVVHLSGHPSVMLEGEGSSEVEWFHRIKNCWRSHWNMGQPRPLFKLFLQSFLQSQLQHWWSIENIRTLLTRPVFMSVMNSTTEGSPGWVCTIVAWLFTSWSSYHGSNSCRKNSWRLNWNINVRKLHQRNFKIGAKAMILFWPTFIFKAVFFKTKFSTKVFARSV